MIDMDQKTPRKEKEKTGLITRDCTEAMNHPRIKAFMAAVNEEVGDGVLSLQQFQGLSFMRYWNNALITEYVEELDDFKFVFFGGAIVEMHGSELTGKYLSEMGFSTTGDQLRDLNLDVINNEERIYSSGTLDYINKDHKNWWHAKIPLSKNGEIYSTLTFEEFD